jgi:hypothetical protein
MTPRRSEWSGIRRWRERVTCTSRKLHAAPAPVRILAIAVIDHLRLFTINLFYHVLCKGSDRRKIIGRAGAGGVLAAQLVHARSDRRKIVCGARAGHVFLQFL